MKLKLGRLRPQKFFAKIRLRQWLFATAKFLFVGAVTTAVAFASLLATAYLVGSLLLDAKDINRIATSVVEQQTGGKLQIDRTQFDLFTGLNISGIQFFPPDPANPIGYVNGGPILEGPLATIKAINFNYDIPKIILGKLYLNALQIVEPNFSIEDNDAITNFSGIIAYRTKNFPAAPSEPLPLTPPEDGGKTTIPMIPINPKDFYLPLLVKIKDVGIKGIGLSYKKTEKREVIQELIIQGLGVDLGADWFGRKSEFFATIGSAKDQSISLHFFQIKGAEKPSEATKSDTAAKSDQSDATAKVAEAAEPEETQKAGKTTKNKKTAKGKKTLKADNMAGVEDTPKTEVFDIITSFETRFALEDLSKINFDLDIDGKKIATPFANFANLDIHSRLRTKIFEDFRGIHIEKLGFDITKAFTYTFQGDVSLPTGTPDLIRLNLDQSFQVDIAHLMELGKPFVKGIDASGKIILESFKIDGEVEPKKLKDIAASHLPFVSAKISLEDITANAAPFNAKLEPVNGTISLAVTPALLGTGYQLDTMVDLQMDEFATTQKSPLGAVSAKIQSLATNIIVRAMYPAMVVPIAKVNTEISHIVVGGGKLANIDVPFLLDLDADAAADFSKIATDLDTELGNLMALKASLDCRNSCQKLRVGTALTLESLEAIHAIAYPIAVMVGAGAVMPTKLNGSIDIQFDAKGTLPNPMKSAPAVILKEGNVRFNTQVTLNDINVKLPLNKVELNEFDTRFSLGGTLDSQKITLRTSFKDLSLVAPGGTAAKPLAVKLDHFDYDLSIKNEFLEKIDLTNPIANLRTAIAMNLHLGEVDAPGTLPQAIKGTSFEFQANQAKLQTVEISKLELHVPDFGITAGLRFKAGLDPDFFPNQVLTTVSLEIDHGGGKDILGLMRTAGKVMLDARVESKDMKALSVAGKTEFKNFFLALNGKNPNDPKVMAVDDIDGILPIKQSLDITDIIAGIRAPKALDVSDSGEKKPGDEVATKPLAESMANFFHKTEDRIAKTSNRAALVDYETVRPFYPEKSPIKIKRIEVANLEMTDLEFDVEVRQNIMALNQFVINFLGGKIQGDFQLALDSAAKNPKDIPKSIRTSLHVTRLNSHKLLERFPQLKGKEGSSLLGSNPYIDATVHLKYDIANSDMDGGIEITSIGKEQLKMILFYVDPDELNPTIGDIRTALNIGDVRLVSIPIKNGEIGLEVDVRLLGAPLPVPKLSKLPVSQIVRNITGAGGGGDDNKKDPNEFEEFFDDEALPKS
jgi:hypothetical protein